MSAKMMVGLIGIGLSIVVGCGGASDEDTESGDGRRTRRAPG